MFFLSVLLGSIFVQTRWMLSFACVADTPPFTVLWKMSCFKTSKTHFICLHKFDSFWNWLIHESPTCVNAMVQLLTKYTTLNIWVLFRTACQHLCTNTSDLWSSTATKCRLVAGHHVFWQVEQGLMFNTILRSYLRTWSELISESFSNHEWASVSFFKDVPCWMVSCIRYHLW